MRKKGFTLIEIIVCIALISVIGVGSFIGIKIVDKKILKDKLDQITDQAVQAAQIYLETNNVAYNQLYNNQNGVSLPLKLLVNEGLLDISNTKLDDSDLENQYVVTFLGGSGSSENCEQITTTTSWSNNQPIYLCMRSDGTSNLATIDPSKYSNKTYVSNEPYYFKGRDPNNYVQLTYTGNSGTVYERTFRIIYIDRNDDIIIQSAESYYIFSVKSKRVSPVGFICMTDSGVDNQKFYNISTKDSAYNSRFSYSEKLYCSSWLGSYTGDSLSNIYINRLTNVKIISGTGAEDNPFILENKS